MKNKVIYRAKIRSGVTTPKEAVIADLETCSKVEFLEEGKYEDGTQYVVVKIFVPPNPKCEFNDEK